MAPDPVDHVDSFENPDATSEQEKKQKSRRPANTAFRQQRLKAWQPILTPKTVLPLFFVVGLVFAPIGGLLLYASAQVQQIAIQYQTCTTEAPTAAFADVPSQYVDMSFRNSTSVSQQPQWRREDTTKSFGPLSINITTPVCYLQFYIPDTLNPPVLFYYRLTNFYQNHRRYVKSFDQDQLLGKVRTKTQIEKSNCDPLQIDSNTGRPYYPCGLIANSLFNDTIGQPVRITTGTNAANETYSMSDTGIAWPSDKEIYKQTSYNYSQVSPPLNWRLRYPEYSPDYPIPNIQEDEAFQVWMRTAGLPAFSKLALRNDDREMDIGTYQVRLEDYFPVTIFDGTKSILITTRTIMGGKNPSLGIAYVVVAGLCVLLGALFLAAHLIKPRKLGDHSYLSWNNEQPSSSAGGRSRAD